MGKFIDLTGSKFGRLTAISYERKNGKTYWTCQCDCGKTTVVWAGNLRNGHTKSCGCLHDEGNPKSIGKATKVSAENRKYKLLGKKFGHLTVISEECPSKDGHSRWGCKCDCGNEDLIIVFGTNLIRGHTQSCGCDRRSHGEKVVQELLEKNNIPFTTEYSPFAFENGYRARFDFFVNNSYIIEYDGETHFKYNLHGWHTEDQYLEQQKRDKIKNQWCLQNNIPLIRIPYTVLSSLSIEDLIPETSKFLIKEANDEEM